jgi:hypothetical protein
MDWKCAEGSKRILRAHFADFWGKAAGVYNNCDSDAKEAVKHEIIALAQRIEYLIKKENSNGTS